MQTAFEALKKTLTSAPCLTLPDSDNKFEVIMNASKDAKTVGMILMQNDHPIAMNQ
jgi:hypothetical protein